MSSFCGQCGTHLSDDSRFCPSCGAEAADAPAPPATRVAPWFPEDHDAPASTEIAPPPGAPLPGPPVTAPAPPAPPPVPPTPGHPGSPSTSNPEAPGRGRRRALLLGIGALVVALVAGGLTVLLLRDDDRPGDGAARGDALDVRPISIDYGLSILDEPGRTWDFTAEDIVTGGRFSPIDPNSRDELYSPTAVTVGDVLVTAISTFDDAAEEEITTLVGLAPDGEVAWTTTGAGHGCWAFDDRYLVCSGYGHGLHVLDPHSGKAIASGDFESLWGIGPAVHRGVLYTVVTSSEGSSELVALDLDDLSVRWQTSVSLGDEYAEVYGVVTATDDEVALDYLDVNDFGNRRLVLDRGTGREISSVAYEEETWIQDSWVVTRDYEAGRVSVNRGEEVVFDGYGDPWWSPTGLRVVDGRIGIDATLYDVRSGEGVWSRDDLATSASTSWTWTSDGSQVLVGSSYQDGGTTTVLDAETGETEWTNGWQFSPEAVTEDAFVVQPHDDDGASWSFQVLDRSTGETAWSREVTDVQPNEDDYGGESLSLYVSDTTVWAVGVEGVRAFTDFPGSEGGDDGDGGDDDGDETAYTTACGAPPEFRPVESRSDFGGVTISYELTATCDGGQWLNHSQLSIPFTVEDRVYAAGYFDFSEDPYWVPDDEGLVLELVYPYQNLEVPEAEIAQAITDDGGSGNVVTVPCEPGPDNELGSVPSSPANGADPDEATTADGVPDQDTDADREDAALETLREIADGDLASVEALDWTNQLSAKKPGTVDDGIVYTADDILALHLEYRSRYPDSLLIWSGDWPGSYGPSFRDYWITLSGLSETTTRPVLRWCRSEGWDEGDCWAKRLLASGDPTDETRHKDVWPPDRANN